jgi:hypothetical protein
MTENSIRSSEGALVVALLVVAMGTSAPAGAVSVAERTAPAETTVGEKVTANVTLTDLYQDPEFESWTLAGDSALRDVTWIVKKYDQTGAKVGQETIDGQSIAVDDIAAAADVNRVEVTVTGESPPVGEYTYPETQQFSVVRLSQVREGGTENQITALEATHSTNESLRARETLDAANQSITSAADEGVNVTQASDLFSLSRSAFTNGNFENAIQLAERAQSIADRRMSGVQSNRERNQLLGAVLAIGLLAILGVAGIYAYRSQGRHQSRLG